jgi:predicted nucleic acid-binding protein
VSRRQSGAVWRGRECGAHVEAAEILTPGQVTDSYLLALAVAHGGRLATFDRRLSVRAVKGGKATLYVIAG